MQKNKTASLPWYRSKIDPALIRELNSRSNARGYRQTVGHLGLVAITGLTAIYAEGRLAWPYLLIILWVHGTVCAFLANGIHELVHGTVFRTRRLNRFFLAVFSLIQWQNHHHFRASHTEHHKFTLHPPADLEVILPTHFSIKRFALEGLVNPKALYDALARNIRLAFGRLDNEWDRHLLFGKKARFRVFRQSRWLLLAHGSIAAISLAYGQWMVLVVVSLTPLYGGLLFLLCNNTQHSGLQSRVTDFRLCCRTIYLNRLLEFLYWRMNYHIEHHMYPSVPCYRLPRLHAAIKHDLPKTHRSLIRVWQEIFDIQSKQQEDPLFEYRQELPSAIATSATPVSR